MRGLLVKIEGRGWLVLCVKSNLILSNVGLSMQITIPKALAVKRGTINSLEAYGHSAHGFRLLFGSSWPPPHRQNAGLCDTTSIGRFSWM